MDIYTDTYKDTYKDTFKESHLQHPPVHAPAYTHAHPAQQSPGNTYQDAYQDTFKDTYKDTYKNIPLTSLPTVETAKLIAAAEEDYMLYSKALPPEEGDQMLLAKVLPGSPKATDSPRIRLTHIPVERVTVPAATAEPTAQQPSSIGKQSPLPPPAKKPVSQPPSADALLGDRDKHWEELWHSRAVELPWSPYASSYNSRAGGVFPQPSAHPPLFVGTLGPVCMCVSLMYAHSIQKVKAYFYLLPIHSCYFF